MVWQLQPPHALEEAPLWPALVDVTVINPGRGRFEHQTISLRGDRIESVRPRSAADPREVRLRVFTNRYVLPGLIDLDVRQPPEFLRLEHLSGLLYLLGGVTTVRDVGTFSDDLRATQAAIDRGALVFPRLIACGAALEGDAPHCASSRTLHDRDQIPRLVQWALSISAEAPVPPEPFQTYMPPIFRALVWPAQLAHVKATMSGSLSDEVMRRVRAAYTARQAGTALHLGTGSPAVYAAPGGSARLALELLIMAGLTREESWAAATRGAGEALGIPQLGTIEPGAPADLLVFREDPTASALAMNSLEAVVARGRLYPAAALLRRIMDHARYENSPVVAAWRNLQVRWHMWRDPPSVLERQLLP